VAHRHEDDLKLQRALNTPGLEQELSAETRPLSGRHGGTVAEDEVRARFRDSPAGKKHPVFLNGYLTGLDTEEHLVRAVQSEIERGLWRGWTQSSARLRTAAEKAAPGRATVCVVSDHGFAAIEHDVNLYAAFREAGLFSVDKDDKVTDWKAMLWPAGGSAAVMLADPKDEQVRLRVKTLLASLASDPANGIDRIWTQDEIQRGRGFPQAAFLVSLKIGYEMAYALSPPLVTKPSNLGMHGYVPERAEMRSSFFIVGPQVARGGPWAKSTCGKSRRPSPLFCKFA